MILSYDLTSYDFILWSYLINLILFDLVLYDLFLWKVCLWETCWVDDHHKNNFFSLRWLLSFWLLVSPFQTVVKSFNCVEFQLWRVSIAISITVSIVESFNCSFNCGEFQLWRVSIAVSTAGSFNCGGEEVSRCGSLTLLLQFRPL